MFKTIANTVMLILKKLCPESRWANVIYLALGYAIANSDNISEFISQVIALFK
jgi:hypothetical protein